MSQSFPRRNISWTDRYQRLIEGQLAHGNARRTFALTIRRRSRMLTMLRGLQGPPITPLSRAPRRAEALDSDSDKVLTLPIGHQGRLSSL